MASKRKTGAQNTVNTPQHYSITRNYTGLAAYRSVHDADIARTAEYQTRCKLSREKIEELKKGTDSKDSALQYEAAQSLVRAAQDVSSQMGDLTHDMRQMKEVCEGLADIVLDLQSSEIDEHPLSERTIQLLNSLNELRETYAVMMGEDGEVTTLEMQQLRGVNASLNSTNDMLQHQLETLRALLVETCEARILAAQSVQVNLPAWLANNADDPFDAIGAARRA
jgi:hypothetical protein